MYRPGSSVGVSRQLIGFFRTAGRYAAPAWMQRIKQRLLLVSARC
jgi:hypothetical protein